MYYRGHCRKRNPKEVEGAELIAQDMQKLHNHCLASQ